MTRHAPSSKNARKRGSRWILPVLVAKVLRNVPVRSKGSEIGFVLCPRTNIAIKSESTVEHNLMLYCYLDPAIDRVMGQSARIWFKGEDGKKTHHTIDVRAQRFDGYIYGFLAKFDSKAVDMALRRFTRFLASVTPKRVADELNYVTERSMPEHEIRNAGLVLSCRREPRSDIDALLVQVAPSIDGDILISDLCAKLGGGMAFRPVVRAIFYGTLECVTEGLISPTTVVRYSGSVKPDFDIDGPALVEGMERATSASPKPVAPKRGEKRASHREA